MLDIASSSGIRADARRGRRSDRVYGAAGSLRAGFIPASHAAWWILMACSGLVLVLGYLATTRRAAESAQHVAAALNPEALIEHTH